MRVWCPYVSAGSGSDVFTDVLADGLRALGLGVEVTSFPHRWQYAPWRLSAKPAPPGTDIIVANSWNAFAFQRPGAKLVVVEHLFVLDPALRAYRSRAQGVFHDTLVRHFVRRSYGVADAVVSLSEYAHRRMRTAFPSAQFRVIRNGIDTDFFCPTADKKEPLGRREVRLLFVGNATRRKGADLLPSILRKLGHGFSLHYTSGLRNEDPFCGEPRMIPLGKLDRQGIRRAYRSADLLLFPSRLEGWPLVVMEALACGTPAIVTCGSSLPEMIDDGANGRVCPLDDVDAIVAAIRQCVADPGTYARMSACARRTAQVRFGRARMAEQYLRLFETLATPSSRAGSAPKSPAREGPS